MAYLASPALSGRESGTPGGDSAAAFLARRNQTLGLRGPFPAACDTAPDCPAALFQFFEVDRRVAQNVAAVIDGRDSGLRTQYVVIGAHYDHIGRFSAGALDPELGFVMHLGADDNASGTAAVLEMARRFAIRPARRTVLVVNFDAEELGLVCSRVFVAHAPIPIRSIVFMLNLDMVGRLRAERLLVDGVRDKPATRELIDRVAAGAGLRVEYTSTIGRRSDHASFSAEGVDAAALFTGFHYDYHRASDIVKKVNLTGLATVIDVAEAIARAQADR